MNSIEYPGVDQPSPQYNKHSSSHMYVLYIIAWNLSTITVIHQAYINQYIDISSMAEVIYVSCIYDELGFHQQLQHSHLHNAHGM